MIVSEPLFRSWVDGGDSVFGVDGSMASPSVCVFVTFDLSWLIGFRSFLVLIFAFQAAGSPTSDGGFVTSLKGRLRCARSWMRLVTCFCASIALASKGGQPPP